MHRWTLDALATTLFFLTIVLAASLSPMASDTWWQLRAGADMWASGRVLLTDTYSHTAAGACSGTAHSVSAPLVRSRARRKSRPPKNPNQAARELRAFHSFPLCKPAPPSSLTTIAGAECATKTTQQSK